MADAGSTTPMRRDALAAGPAFEGRAGTIALPPKGASPAGDLQRRLEDAALVSSSQTNDSPEWPGLARWGSVIACAGLCWGAVFGIRALLP